MRPLVTCSKCGEAKKESQFSQRQLKTKKICKKCVNLALNQKVDQSCTSNDAQGRGVTESVEKELMEPVPEKSTPPPGMSKATPAVPVVPAAPAVPAVPTKNTPPPGMSKHTPAVPAKSTPPPGMSKAVPAVPAKSTPPGMSKPTPAVPTKNTPPPGMSKAVPAKSTPPPGMSKPVPVAPAKSTPPPSMSKPTPTVPAKSTPPSGMSKPVPTVPAKNTPPPGMSKPVPTVPVAPAKSTSPPGMNKAVPAVPTKNTPPSGMSKPVPTVPAKNTPPPGMSKPVPTVPVAPAKSTPPPGMNKAVPAVPAKSTPPSGMSKPVPTVQKKSTPPSGMSKPTPTVPAKNTPPHGMSKPTPTVPAKSTPPPGMSKPTPTVPAKSTPPPGMSKPVPAKNTPPPGMSKPTPTVPAKNTPPPGMSKSTHPQFKPTSMFAQKAKERKEPQHPPMLPKAEPIPPPPSIESSQQPITEEEEEIPSIVVGEGTYSFVPYKQYAYPQKQYGTKGKPLDVLANHYRVKLPDSITFYCYDVTFTTFSKNKEIPAKLNKVKAKEVFELFKRTNEYNQVVQSAFFVFDGKKIGWSTVKVEACEGQVEMIEEKGKPPVYYNVSIKLTPRVSKINKETLNNRDYVNDMTPLDMFHVYKKTLTSPYTKRAVFDLHSKPISIGKGVCLHWGYSQSFRLSDGGFFNVMEPVTSPFYCSGPLLRFVKDFLGPQILDHSDDSQSCCIGEKSIHLLAHELRGVKVSTTHLGYERDYVIDGISKNCAAQEFFDWEKNGKTKRISVYEYFKEQYKIELKHPGLPCITKGKLMVPIEVCNIKPGQRYPYKLNAKQQSNATREGAILPKERREKLCDYSRKTEFIGDDYLRSLGVEVSSEMTKVKGRLLEAPSLVAKKNDNLTTIQAKDGQWDIKDVMPYKSVDLKHYTIVILENEPGNRWNRRDPIDSKNVFKFYDSLSQYGVNIDKTILNTLYKKGFKRINVDDRKVSLHNELVRYCEQQKREQGSLQLIFIVLPEKSDEIYRKVKNVTDSVLGIPSQCIVYDMSKILKPQYISNVCLKITTKLGGINSILSDYSSLIKKNTMVLGADVTHPMAYEAEVSIAAVVATVDPYFTRYVGEAQAQPAHQEIIQDLEGMMVKLFTHYQAENHGQLPDYLLFYRDGVGDGQFDIVLKEEIPRIYAAASCMAPHYVPKLTFLIVQKRHPTRLFPVDVNNLQLASKKGNLKSGVVVDRVITDKFLYDFFLQSHNVINGTGRCGYYVVLYDSIKINADALQEITYKLCYTFCRCNKSISVCAPARYAHHLAFRYRDILGIANGRRNKENDYSFTINKLINEKMYFI